MVEYSQEERYSKPKDVKDLLVIALRREKAAVGFYEEMLQYSFAEKAGGVIEELKRLEEAHVRLLENQLKQIE